MYRAKRAASSLRLLTLTPTLMLALVVSLSAVSASAGDDSVYNQNCQSCHGQDGKAATPVGAALKIPSFEGSTFTAEQIKILLTQSESHSGLGIDVSKLDLDGFVAFLNTLAQAP